jgi:membrane protein involved in colicin uptake
MPRYNDDDDRPRRTWREIDKQKDRSKHRQEDRPIADKKKQVRAKSASQVYRSKLDAFFEGEGKAPEHVKEKIEAVKKSDQKGDSRAAALKAIKEANSSAAADKAVAAYLTEWEIPPDYDILCQVLTCSEEKYVGMAMDQLSKMLAERHIPRRAALLEQRLRRVKTLSEDRDLQDKAEVLIRQIRLYS